VIAKQPKLEEERRRREIVWLGNLLYAAAHFFADVFNAQRWRLSERAKCFSLLLCAVCGGVVDMEIIPTVTFFFFF
jgi:hypothetical protein